jgi:hypothetical protein
MSLSVCVISLSFLAFTDPSAARETARRDSIEYTIETHAFLLPIRIAPGRKDEIQSISLYLAADGGRSWSKIATIGLDEEGFPFRAQEDGVYLFALQLVDKKGVKYPDKVGKDGTLVTKVRVDTRHDKMTYAD